MRRTTSSKISDKPMAPRGIDLEIGRHNGRTVALDATPESLQASKKVTGGDLSRRIEELTRENGQLRLEIRYLQDCYNIFQELREDAGFLADKMETSILVFDESHRKIEDDRYRAMEGI